MFMNEYGSKNIIYITVYDQSKSKFTSLQI